METKIKETYYNLVNIIKSQGEPRPKRHGEYVKLHIFDDYFLDLDTWNKSISVYRGDNRIDNLGIDFGGFRANITMTKFWLAHLKRNQ